MRHTIKRAVTSTLIGAAALTGISVASPDADAARYGIANGYYTFKLKNDLPWDHGTAYAKAWVKGNRITIKSPGASAQSYGLHAVRNGGYFDFLTIRPTFSRSGNGTYSGTLYNAGIPTGRSYLIPR